MRYFLICFLLPLLAFSQARNNRELPIFEPIPYFEAGDSLQGWSLSSDGQWISRPKTIPMIGISRNEDFYQRESNRLGIDNIQKLLAYKVKYGKDTLICLLKIYRDGAFKYPNRRKGWKEFTAGYFWLVRYRDLKQALNYFEKQDTGEAFVLRIKSLEGRSIKEIEDERTVLKKIMNSTIVKPDFDRNLVLTIQSSEDPNLIRMHLCSLHVIFTDVEGVRQNFTKRGRSVYGSVRLFDYVYFEMNRKEFFEILDLDSNFDQLLQEKMDPVFQSAPDSLYDDLDSLDFD